MRMEDRTERKRRGQAMLRAGTAGKDVAAALGVDAATVSRWKRDLEPAAEAEGEPMETARDPERDRPAAEVPEDEPNPGEAPAPAGREKAPAHPGRPARERRARAVFSLSMALLVRLDAVAEAESVPVSAVAERLMRQALGE